MTYEEALKYLKDKHPADFENSPEFPASLLEKNTGSGSTLMTNSMIDNIKTDVDQMVVTSNKESPDRATARRLHYPQK